MAHTILSALATLLVIITANALVCYKCNSKDSVHCKWGMTSFIYKTEECATTAILNSIIPVKCFKISAENKKGKQYIARGCLPSGTIGCNAMAKAVGWIGSAASDDADSLKNLSCDTCATDKCNAAGRPAGFAFVGLVSSAFAFLL